MTHFSNSVYFSNSTLSLFTSLFTSRRGLTLILMALAVFLVPDLAMAEDGDFSFGPEEESAGAVMESVKKWFMWGVNATIYVALTLIIVSMLNDQVRRGLWWYILALVIAVLIVAISEGIITKAGLDTGIYDSTTGSLMISPTLDFVKALS